MISPRNHCCIFVRSAASHISYIYWLVGHVKGKRCSNSYISLHYWPCIICPESLLSPIYPAPLDYSFFRISFRYQLTSMVCKNQLDPSWNRQLCVLSQASLLVLSRILSDSYKVPQLSELHFYVPLPLMWAGPSFTILIFSSLKDPVSKALYYM